MCEDCGKLKASSNNYFVPLGCFFAELSLQEAIREGAMIVIPLKEEESGK